MPPQYLLTWNKNKERKPPFFAVVGIGFLGAGRRYAFLSYRGLKWSHMTAIKSTSIMHRTNKLHCYRFVWVGAKFDTCTASWACKCTAKTPYRKYETNVLRKETARPQSQFLHSCFCERFIHSHDRSAYSAAGKQVDRSWEYIDCSQTHKCGN